VTESDSTAHDPDTIGMLRRVLDDAWETLSPHQQTQANKSIMAQGLLKLAADGERDPTPGYASCTDRRGSGLRSC
jgi:hypothetical protein